MLGPKPSALPLGDDPLFHARLSIAQSVHFRHVDVRWNHQYHQYMKKSLMPSIMRYQKRYVRHDVMAAIVVTAIAIPQSLGFAMIVGLPPVTGLYTAAIAPIVFGLLAHSRRLVIGADSATAALIASGAMLIAQAGTAQYANAVALLSLMVALILMLMALFRFGFLANLISRPVMIGFLAGVGVQLVLTSLPQIFGIAAHGTMWQQLVQSAGQLMNSNGAALLLAGVVVLVTIMMRRSRIPGELVGIIVAMLVAIPLHVHVALVGDVPAGLPGFTLPHFTGMNDIVVMIPVALSIALVVLAQSSTVIRNLANAHDDPIRLNRDLFALGVANIASACGRGFIANGSPPRSIAADGARGKTQLVNILSGIFMTIILLIGTPLIAKMPVAALSAVVLLLGIRLIKIDEFRTIWSASKAEFLVAALALLGTIIFGVLEGIVIAVAVSLIERLRRQYKPKDGILLRDGAASLWALDRLGRGPHPDNVLIYGFNGALFFENTTYFTRRLRQAVARAKHPVNYVIIDAGAIDDIDYTAVEEMKLLYRQLSTDDIQLLFAHVSPELLLEFDRFGLTDLVGRANMYPTLARSVQALRTVRKTAVEKIIGLKLAPSSYVVVGGAVLELLHLRASVDIDVVVSDRAYRAFRAKKSWKEVTLENSKKLLTRGGVNVMREWDTLSLRRLQKDAHVVEKIPVMDVKLLIVHKRHLAKRKDLADIALLRQFLAR